jgi:hypothetical protein
VDAEVEPYLAVNPTSSANLVAVWQQDRWSNGAAQGLVAGASFDDGATWTRSALPFSVCAGGTSANGGDFARASDPWISISPDGTAHALGLAVTGTLLAANSESAILVARSQDGGMTWGDPIAVIREPGPVGNDKGSITADPTDPRFVYAIWDRLTGAGTGPAWFARTSDGGASWEPAREIYDPGRDSQTIGNLIAVLPDGDLVAFFTQIDVDSTGLATATLRVMRSNDRGTSWDPPQTIAELLAIGAFDPDTGQPIRDGSILGALAVGPSGQLHVVWQDARFSNGARDGIAYSSSTDAVVWSDPVQANADADVQAFTPAIHVRADGVVGVSYFDLRSNTSNSASLPTDYWLATSSDGQTWTETRIAAAFDLSVAPDAGGLFLGDYMGLASAGAGFLALHAITIDTSTANRTDIVLTPTQPAANAAARLMQKSGLAVSGTDVSSGWRTRTDQLIRASMERRIPGGYALHFRSGR